MKTAIANLKSITPYSQSRGHQAEKLPKESAEDYERRTWRERLHVDEQTGNVFIPPMAFKNCLSEIAKYLSMQIPGKGKSTYTKHFEAGVMCADPLILPIKAEEVSGEWLFVPSNGTRGGGRRVWRCFPRISAWEGQVKFVVLDETITRDVFFEHLQQAGAFIGIGRFRPRQNGYYGRFSVEKLEWN